MEKTELMKRYETEMDEIATWHWHDKEFVTDDYIAWLEAQLTWRPVTEKPEISDKYYVIRKGFAITFRDICLFMDGEWCVNRVSEEHGGEYWQPIEKDNTCPVVLWFPAPIIPPAPEKV